MKSEVVVFYSLLIIVAFVIGTCLGEGPLGTCPDKDGTTTVYLPDSEKCELFYICSGGTPWQQSCSPGLHWNRAVNTCDYPAEANCPNA
ncbi:hypothetical protein GHT06_021025 [Daphnia sinensis]|uniref:Chitin-binding type-2 domain-containing protein n=1 Tax=Daphnia sinensis TaxID=1820382 RepID=A0AAD5KZX6_9CRUS|nr:hypothetical protein GHT06_021025 [Daphnia sinensis]